MPGGRPKAATTLRTRDIAERASREGITPLEVLIEIMRERWSFYKAQRETPTESQTNINHAAAAAIEAAEKVAPYMHPKLASVEFSGGIEHSYAARLPTPIEDAEQWRLQHSPAAQLLTTH